jgi:hypothetical protein
MELEKFISQTLSEIQKGVQGAIDATQSTKGAINPHFGSEITFGPHLVQNVEFDIAVTVSNENELSGGGGIKVVGFKLGAEGKDSIQNSSVSRVQFTIPIIPPVQWVKIEGLDSIEQEY